MKSKFKLQECENQEINLNLTYQKKNFLIKYNVDCNGDIELLEVCANEYDIMEMIHDEMLNDIKTLIFKKIQKEEESNYIDFMYA